MTPKIAGLKNCFGCGVCAAACPRKIIDIRLDADGFYRPFIDEIDSCIGCHICDDTCAFLNPDNEFPAPVGSFAVWSTDDETRARSSSGGVSLEIARKLMSDGYKFCGVRYDIQKHRAEHFIASTPEEAIESCGSKYIQSYTPDAFKKIDLKEKYLVVGTPCQIASFRRYIRRFNHEDNFVLMDFYCHSVPSMHAWKHYITKVKKTHGEIARVSWRDKKNGWHNSYRILIDLISQTKSGSPNQYSSAFSDGDIFYRLFLWDLCNNEACEKSCIYKKNKSQADIRLGDLWGNTYHNDKKGVSAVVAFTPKGKSVIENLDTCVRKPHTFEVVTEGQMKNNIRHASMRGLMIKYLRTGHASTAIVKAMIFMQRIINKTNRTLKIK